MKAAKVMVVGAGYAGVLVAQRLARLAGPLAEVTLVNPSAEFVERIRLHEVAAGKPATARPIQAWLQGTGARLRVARVTGVDLARRRVQLEADSMVVDQLVLTTGSRTSVTVPGAEVHRLDDPDAARALARAAARCAVAGQSLVVVGGGLTAIEAATELAAGYPGLKVVLVCAGGLGEGVLGPAAIEHVRAALERHGVSIHERVRVRDVDALGVHSDSGRLEAGAVCWAAGFEASPLARSLGLRTDGLARTLVTEQLHSHDQPWIWSAGDAATITSPAGHAIDTGAPLHMACKTASPMAWLLANNLNAALRGQPLAAFRWADAGVCVSLGRQDGVIQMRGDDGSNKRVIRGRLGAWVKERVCRATVAAFEHRWLQLAHRSSVRRGERLVAPRATTPSALPARPSHALSSEP